MMAAGFRLGVCLNVLLYTLHVTGKSYLCVATPRQTGKMPEIFEFAGDNIKGASTHYSKMIPSLWSFHSGANWEKFMSFLLLLIHLSGPPAWPAL